MKITKKLKNKLMQTKESKKQFRKKKVNLGRELLLQATNRYEFTTLKYIYHSQIYIYIYIC
jgi:hypothetical protein